MSKNTSAKLRVVFDTNIYLAAAIRPGMAEELVHQSFRGRYSAFISQPILDELSRKLIEKELYDDPGTKILLARIRQHVEKVEPQEKIDAVKRDPDDNKILECAVAAQANLIITLDQDLLKLKKFRQIGIVHPKTFRWIVPEK